MTEATDSALPGVEKGILLPSSLEHARITTLPQTAYYIPNFITEEEEQMILDKVGAYKTQHA
jgi:alkylated DNA repair protein alkB family protein 6